jgi:hypothetical protein
MTIVDMCAIFQKNDFKQIIEEYAENLTDKSMFNYINETLNSLEYVEPVNYSQLLEIRRKNKIQYKYKNDIISKNLSNPFKNNNP